MKIKLALAFILLLLFYVDLSAVNINGLSYVLHEKERTATVTSGTSKAVMAGILTIPEYVTFEQKNYRVVEIDAHAFSGRKDIEWINFPPTIEIVREGAFDGCRELWSYSWPGDATFMIEACAFRNCEKLQVFTFPPLLRVLGAHALEGCRSLTTLIIGSHLTEIPYQLCKNCTSLSEVVIYPGSFESLKNIRDQCFAGCKNLSLVILCANLKKMGSEVFHGCTKLSHFTCTSPYPCEFNADTFDENHYKEVRLEIPKGAYDSYINTRYWNKFFNIEEAEETGISSIAEDETKETEIYFINGYKTGRKRLGVNIVRKPDGTLLKVIYKGK